MTEHWKPVVGFEGLYEVSDCGRVRSLDRMIGEGSGRGGERFWPGRPLKVQYRPDGYAIVSLHNEGRSYPRLVHRLVLEAFVGPRPHGHQAAHKSGVKRNCRLSNLQWKTPVENARDKIRHGTSGRGSASPFAKLTEADVRAIRSARGTTRRALALKHGVTETAIDKVIWRQRWAHI